MNKKIIGIALGIGAVIAIGLGVILSMKSSEAAKQLEIVVNKHFLQIADEYGGFMPSHKPFKCKGAISISCYSDEIVLGYDSDTSFVLKDVGFDIESASNSALKLVFNIKNIALQTPSIENLGFDTLEDSQKQAAIENFEQTTAIFQNLVPKHIKCQIALNKQDDKLLESSQCDITSNDATFKLDGEFGYLHEAFKEANIAQIIKSFYFDSLFDFGEFSIESDAYAKYQVALKRINASMQDKGFSKDMYAYYKLQSALYGLFNEERDGFKQYANNINMMILLALSFIVDKSYSAEAIAFGNAVESIILGDIKELSVEIKQQAQELEFMPPEQLDLTNHDINITTN